jgi:prephenate dehydratase
VRVGYLGPAGTFSEEALEASVRAGEVVGELERVPQPTIRGAVMAVQRGEVARAIVPIENSIEGAVTVTLDTLVGEASDVAIVGEIVRPVRQSLIASAPIALGDVEVVVSHPQATGQCARFLREQLPQALVRSADSTAGAVRALLGAEGRPWAALGPAYAAPIYGCVVLAEGVQDEADNETRFVWLALSPTAPGAGPAADVDAGAITGSADADEDASAITGAVVAGRDAGAGAGAGAGARVDARAWKTSMVFWGAGATSPGWLVGCLDEFARREVNLTRIESRPTRERLGRYMFFVDVEGSAAVEPLVTALEALRGHCEEVRVLGSYPAAVA